MMCLVVFAAVWWWGRSVWWSLGLSRLGGVVCVSVIGECVVTGGVAEEEEDEEEEEARGGCA